ncbi:MAG: hypothetical protein EOO50_02415 [Flavobacterium sp.]|uniref:carboxypeptidase-like regulatory domain-containing protein n=1 Tax=Flavobacterium sp. TaxID=239 RepID=UPI0012019148|nr:carboxypeptidase-like regulatory domain-containing protein [Flavobacterium sp.]RZJ68293.1 MAG: hypothetical protein EOO50_02415 [Flavobacterium sp.]
MKLLLFLLLSGFASAQTLTVSGVVLDENNATMPGVSVYLDGTSIGVLTDEKGTFELSVKSRINTNLIISFIGFETVIVENPFGKRRYEIHMQPKATELREVVIGNEGFSRDKKLKAFRAHFLGDTKAGRACKILNEDDIYFKYDVKTNTLTAGSDAPLRISNPYLGYEVTFSLVEFWIEFPYKTVKPETAVGSFYAGTTVYQEMTGDKKKFSDHRSKSYLGSQMHFFRNLLNNKWGKDDFELYSGSWPANPVEYFTVGGQSEGVYAVNVKSDAKINSANTLNAPKFYSSFNLMYDRKKQSKVIFKTPTFHVDEYGNTDSAYEITFGGEMSKLRVGDLLPMDYSQ